MYQRDVDKCLDALGQMGVLVGGDRTAIKRTAEYFLKQFEQRLAEQRAERERDPDSQNSFKPKRSKEESKEKRKAVRISESSVCRALAWLPVWGSHQLQNLGHIRPEKALKAFCSLADFSKHR